jgi:hypothetical protein
MGEDACASFVKRVSGSSAPLTCSRTRRRELAHDIALACGFASMLRLLALVSRHFGVARGDSTYTSSGARAESCLEAEPHGGRESAPPRRLPTGGKFRWLHGHVRRLAARRVRVTSPVCIRDESDHSVRRRRRACSAGGMRRASRTANGSAINGRPRDRPRSSSVPRRHQAWKFRTTLWRLRGERDGLSTDGLQVVRGGDSSRHSEPSRAALRS